MRVLLLQNLFFHFARVICLHSFQYPLAFFFILHHQVVHSGILMDIEYTGRCSNRELKGPYFKEAYKTSQNKYTKLFQIYYQQISI